ncbi:prepilin peptidase [Sapientia aquatica]|uniref:Prepilin leader peptidase/N-methyltransferase n=1 Tax=Sapientia aquatica TaxID=1549640 RepID=A0A4R5VYQ2_9BURK|nr:A24 family peptidase [Sapientia aquatica]TDK64516.1 prepilin peptidase [Sapientia aquatica]
MNLADLYVTGPGNFAVSLVAALFGLLIGSFLNVVVYRIPKMMQRELDNYVAEQNGQALPHQDVFNLMLPRSACPHCGHQITAIENIPVVSYLALRGRCSGCKSPISARYPLVETATALITFGMVWHFGTGLAGIAAVVFGFFLITLALIDFDTQLLPDDITYPLLWCGLLLNTQGVFCTLQEAVVGAAIGYLALWSVYWVFKLVTGKEGMGYGDFKLLAALGAWCGWAVLPAIILASSLAGAVIGIGLIVFTKRERDVPMPFGPYLVIAGLIMLPFGRMLTQNYLGIVL